MGSPDAARPDRKRWFCFANPDRARAAFVPADASREAVVVVGGYVVNRYFSEAWDTAERVDLIATGAPRTATLRDPGAQPDVDLTVPDATP
jgi:hypothetical protein